MLAKTSSIDLSSLLKLFVDVPATVEKDVTTNKESRVFFIFKYHILFY